MKIGNAEISGNVFLAPMAGVTDKVFREICEEFGADATYSEMVSAKGLYYKDRKTAELLERGGAKPYAVQIFGSDADIMGEIAACASEYGDILDINMGCPTPKIVNNGDGSALLRDIPKIETIVKKVVFGTKKPVSVKIRLGWDSFNACDVARAIEASGASAIAVHGRTRSQFYSGVADIESIAKVVKSVKIPVIANGDIFTPEDARRMLDYTGAAAIMIGRGAEGNPFIFKRIKEFLENGKCEYNPTNKEIIHVAINHVTRLAEHKGEERGIKEARKHLAWYLKGMRDNGFVKNLIFKSTNLNEIQEILGEFCDRLSK